MRFTKEFPDYESCTLWLYARGFKSGVIDIMQNDDVILYLDGVDAERAYDAQHGPLAPGGFRLRESEQFEGFP